MSVDLRLIPDLFSDPIVEWGTELIHYVPIAQLRKQRLIHFDLRDEEDRALPLITKHRNATITAAMLCAAAQTVIASRINHAELGFEITEPSRIKIPAQLEHSFWLLAFLDPSRPDGGARAIFDKFKPSRENLYLPLVDWEWHTDQNQTMKTNASVDDWHSTLGSDAAFVRLAWDVSRLFIILAPLPHELGRRRIVKFSYTEYLGEGLGPFHGVKATAAKLGLAPSWNRWEDWLEGLPQSSPQTPDEWVPTLSSSQPPRVRMRRKVFEAIGWTTQTGKFEAPGVAHGSSYHIEISTPDGVQIRRAQLVTAGLNNKKDYHSPQRGNRTLHAVDLHVAQMPPSHAGNAYLNLRPESSLIVRAATFTSTLTAIALTLLWVFSRQITADGDAHTTAAAAALVVIPGLLTILGARDVEHPLATSMVFGIRVLAMTPGVLAFLAAGQLIVGNPHSWAGIVLFGLAWAIAFLFAVAWRLASRGRPHRHAV